MSLAVQAGIFAAGLSIGALAAVSTSKGSSGTRDSPARSSPLQGQLPNPAVAGGTVLSPGGAVGTSATTVFGNVDVAASANLLKYGFPGPVSDVLKRTAYVAAYDRQKRHPAWTAEHLTAASLRRLPVADTPLPPTASGSSSSSYAEALVKQQQERQQIPSGDRANSVFREDVEVPDKFRARLEDYFRSGYDRGHMVPAADAKRSQDAMDETFLLSNIAPQVGEGFNRHYWAYVEDFCRRLTGSFSDVYVFTIPLYLPKRDLDGKWRVSYEVIGAQAAGGIPSVAVPTHFAKVIMGAKPSSPATPLVQDTSLGAFVLPNAAIPDATAFETFQVPVDAVEKAAGLTLFDEVTKATSKELCRQVKCEVIVRRFDDARKQGDKSSRRGSVSGSR